MTDLLLLTNTFKKAQRLKMTRIYGRQSALRVSYLKTGQIKDLSTINELFGSLAEFLQSVDRRKVNAIGKEKGLFNTYLATVKDKYQDEVTTLLDTQTVLTDIERKDLISKLKKGLRLDSHAIEYQKFGVNPDLYGADEVKEALEMVISQDNSIRQTYNYLAKKMHGTMLKKSEDYLKFWTAQGLDRFNSKVLLQV